MSESDPKKIAEALVSARLSCEFLDGFPGQLPQSLEAAYEVQKHATSIYPAELIGFKAGGVPEQFQEQYPSKWQLGPIFSDQRYFVQSGERIDVTVYEDSFAAYEAEFIIAVEGFLDRTAPIETIEEAKTFIKDVYFGAEIASSPNANVNALGPGSIISDFGNNAGVVLGPLVPTSLLEDLSAVEVTLYIDEQEIGRANPNLGANGPFGALLKVLNHLIERRDEFNFPERVLISSGAVTGVHQSKVGTVGRLKFGEYAEFELAMVARKPKAIA